MAYALEPGVRGALNDAYKRRLEAEAQAAGEPPRRPTPALGIPNPTRGRLAAMPRRQSSSDKTKAFDFGEPQTAVGDGSVQEQPPATQSFTPRTQGGSLPEAKKTLAYNDRAQLDQALAEAGVQLPGTGAGAESDKAGLKRTMAYALPGDQLEAARQEAMAAARAEAEASVPRQQRGMTAPARNKPQLKSTMAFLPPATGAAGAAGPAGPAAGAGQPKSPQGVSLPSVTAKRPEQAAVNAGLSSTIAFSGGLAEEPTASRAPYVSRPAEEEVNLGETLVAGVGPGPSRPQDNEVTRVSPGLADAAPAAPVPHVAVQEAAPAAPAQQQGGYPPLAGQSGAVRPGYPPSPQGVSGQPGAAGHGGYPPAPIAGSTAGPATVALPDTAQGAFVRPPMEMSAPVGAPPPVPLVQAQPMQVTTTNDKTVLIVAIVVGVVTVLALLGGAIFWLML